MVDKCRRFWRAANVEAGKFAVSGIFRRQARPSQDSSNSTSSTGRSGLLHMMPPAREQCFSCVCVTSSVSRAVFRELVCVTTGQPIAEPTEESRFRQEAQNNLPAAVGPWKEVPGFFQVSNSSAGWLPPLVALQLSSDSRNEARLEEKEACGMSSAVLALAVSLELAGQGASPLSLPVARLSHPATPRCRVTARGL